VSTVTLWVVGFPDTDNVYVPQRIRSLNAEKCYIAIAGGKHHSLALDEHG